MKPLIIKKTVESFVDEYQCQECSRIFGTLYEYELHWKNSHSFTKTLKTKSGYVLYYFESEENAKKFQFGTWEGSAWYIEKWNEYDEQWELMSVSKWIQDKQEEIQDKQNEIEEIQQAIA